MKTTHPTLATVPSALAHHFTQANTFLNKASGHLASIDPEAFQALGPAEFAAFQTAVTALAAAHAALVDARACTPTVTRRPRKK